MIAILVVKRHFHARIIASLPALNLSLSELSMIGTSLRSGLCWNIIWDLLSWTTISSDALTTLFNIGLLLGWELYICSICKSVLSSHQWFFCVRNTWMGPKLDLVSKCFSAWSSDSYVECHLAKGSTQIIRGVSQRLRSDQCWSTGGSCKS